MKTITLRELVRWVRRRQATARATREAAAWRALVHSFDDSWPEPDELVLMWHETDGWSVQDFDHDSDAAWWQERGYTRWAPLPPPLDEARRLGES